MKECVLCALIIGVVGPERSYATRPALFMAFQTQEEDEDDIFEEHCAIASVSSSPYVVTIEMNSRPRLRRRRWQTNF